MRVLVCIARYGTSKDYALDIFNRMMRAVLDHTKHEVDVLWVTDQEGPAPDYVDFLEAGTPGLIYSDDMLPEAHEKSLVLADAMRYDKLVWQGLDMIYDDPADFDRLITERAIVSALVSSRTDARMAVARRFERPSSRYAPQQYPIPDDELLAGMGLDHFVAAGYPSSDNLVIDSEYFGIRIPHFVPWYKKKDMGEEPICYEEEWCLKALNAGADSWVHCGVRPWHLHEVDDLARRYPNIVMPRMLLHTKPWVFYY